jgi:hypothetical protein
MRPCLVLAAIEDPADTAPAATTLSPATSVIDAAFRLAVRHSAANTLRHRLNRTSTAERPSHDHMAARSSTCDGVFSSWCINLLPQPLSPRKRMAEAMSWRCRGDRPEGDVPRTRRVIRVMRPSRVQKGVSMVPGETTLTRRARDRPRPTCCANELVGAGAAGNEKSGTLRLDPGVDSASRVASKGAHHARRRGRMRASA